MTTTVERGPALLTAREVAQMLRVTVATVHRLAGNALPAAIRVGNQYRFRASDIHALLDA